MNEELKKLLDSIKAKKQEVKDLCKAGKIEDAANAKEELKNLQAQFDLLYDLEQEALNEGSDKDGGLTVPQDIKTKIRELRRSEDALELLVNVERVSTLSGSRVIEKHADQTPFDNVDEAAEFPEASTPEFALIKYKVKKKGGILKITQELLSDTAENIIGYM